MYLAIAFLAIIFIALYALMWYLIVLWYRDAKPKAIARFREGFTNKEQCRKEVAKDKIASISMAITLTLFSLYGIEEFAKFCNLIPQDTFFFGKAIAILVIVSILLLVLKLIFKYPFLSLCLSFILIPFGGNHHPNWRHRIKHWRRMGH